MEPKTWKVKSQHSRLKFLFSGYVNLRRKRKLTAVTNKTTVAHNCHGKIYLLTAKSISSQQNQFRHGKINFITAKLISPRQNQFRKRKINLAIAKSISPGQNQIYTRDNQFHNTANSNLHAGQSISQYGKINFSQDKIIFTHDKINFTHGKIILHRAECYCLSRHVLAVPSAE